MRFKSLTIALAVSAFVMSARAQGVESPPVTSFKPDTSMPSVNVPEFVITGKAEVELPRADKPTVEIDSSYFQDKDIRGVSVDVPLNRALSSREQKTAGSSPSLFARASIGHYTTVHYLVSGSGGVAGYMLNGSVSGDYTSGFIPYTISRNFVIQGGVEKDFSLAQRVETSNDLNLGYSRDSYFLYGGWPAELHRTVNRFSAGFQSGVNFGGLPLTATLGFNRLSFDDQVASAIQDAESMGSLELSTGFELPSGNLNVGVSMQAGNHFVAPRLVVYGPYTLLSLDRSNYTISAGVGYSNRFQNLFYSLALRYYQYRDDMVDGIGKLYPDLNATYKIDDMTSLFVNFSGKITQQTLSSILSTDRFTDSGFPLINTQDFADFTFGANISLPGGFRLMPQFNVQGLRHYPVFVTPLLTIQEAPAGSADNSFFYAEKATIFSASIAATYASGRLSADGKIEFLFGQADSLSSIPNMPHLDLNLGGSYKITPEFTASANFLFLSSRYTDLSLSQQLDPVAQLNFRLSYDFHISKLPFEIFMGGNNIFNQKYFVWQGYQEFPLMLYIGFSSRIL